MKEQVSKEALRGQAIQTLAFLCGDDWVEQLNVRGDVERAISLKKCLVSAGIGIGDCMDERPSLTASDLSRLQAGASQQDQLKARRFVPRNLEHPLPSMVGGAAGWVPQFMMDGQNLGHAVQSTQRLYKAAGWGDMIIHNDDDHGQITSLEALLARNVGCGFLSVLPDVVSILKALNLCSRDIPASGQEIFDALAAAGAKIVPLTGNHKKEEAAVAVNSVADKTLPKDAMFADNNPVFVWDMWATTAPHVIAKYNEMALTFHDISGVMRRQAGLHLAAGLMLEVLRFPDAVSNLKGNLAIIE